MDEVINRLKSPIVIIQIISILTALAIYFLPDSSETIQAITTAVVSAINILAGLNNPADKENF